jgi:hypothetical protein
MPQQGEAPPAVPDIGARAVESVVELKESAVVLAAASELVQGVKPLESMAGTSRMRIMRTWASSLSDQAVLELLRCSREEGTVDLEHLKRLLT